MGRQSVSEFAINTLVWGDQVALGLWEVGHYRAHLAWNNALAALAHPVIIPAYPILDLVSLDDEQIKFWKDAHENWHQAIRPFTNVTGVDLSFVNFRDADSFYEWQDLHNQEHALIDHALGIT